MAWIKLDDQFRNHPKILAAGPLASWLYVCGLTFAGQYLTDGHIPSTMLGMLAAVDNAQELADRLVDVGLWEEVDGGYQIHDFTEYNPTREEVRGIRAARAEAGRRGGLNSAASKRQANATANEQQNSTPSPSPSPSPIPIPGPGPSSSPSPADDDDETEIVARIFCLWEDRFGRLTDIQRQEVAYRLDEHGASRLCEALDATIANNGRSIAYLDTVLANWGKGKPRSRASPANHVEGDYDFEAYGDALKAERERNEQQDDGAD